MVYLSGFMLLLDKASDFDANTTGRATGLVGITPCHRVVKSSNDLEHQNKTASNTKRRVATRVEVTTK